MKHIIYLSSAVLLLIFFNIFINKPARKNIIQTDNSEPYVFNYARERLYGSYADNNRECSHEKEAEICYHSIPYKDRSIEFYKNGKMVYSLESNFNNPDIFNAKVSPDYKYGITSNLLTDSTPENLERVKIFVYNFEDQQFLSVDSEVQQELSNVAGDKDQFSVDYFWSPKDNVIYMKPHGAFNIGQDVILTKIEKDSLKFVKTLYFKGENIVFSEWDLDRNALKASVVTQYVKGLGSDQKVVENSYEIWINEKGNLSY